jgi:hypothetical protein
LVSTPNIAEPVAGLLGDLTDDELARCAEIARDQMRRELRNWWVQILFACGAVASVVWMGWGLIVSGVSRSTLLPLGLSAVLGYVPYRKAKVRSLWQRHCDAVEAEQERRRIASS